MSTPSAAIAAPEIPVIEDWVSTVDAAVELGMSRQYLHRLAADSEGDAFRSPTSGEHEVRLVSATGPKQYLIRRAALDRYVEAREATAARRLRRALPGDVSAGT